MKRHIVLIGLPGSGKSAVGKLVADALGAALVDIDSILNRKEGKPITMIFAEKGEPAFREMERKEMETALAAEPSVIAPGGGWAAQPRALEAAKIAAYVVYLKTKADIATVRAAPAGTRPTLMGEDPEAVMRTLLQEREPFYQQAHAMVETDRMTAEQVAHEVAQLARTRAGW